MVMDPQSTLSHFTPECVALFLRGTPPPPLGARLDLTAPRSSVARLERRSAPVMSWNFFTRITRELRRAGVEDLVLSHLGDSYACAWLLDALLFAKHFCGFPHVVLRVDALSVTSERLAAAVRSDIDALVFNFDLSSQEWAAARLRLQDDKSFFVRKLHRAKEVRAQALASSQHRCLIFVAKIGAASPADSAVDAAMARMAMQADHQFSAWVHDAEDIVGANPAPVMRVEEVDPRLRLCACWMPFNEAHIASDGHLAACRYDVDGRSYMADLNRTPFLEAWHSPTFQTLRTALIAGHVAGTSCAGCPWKSGNAN